MADQITADLTFVYTPDSAGEGMSVAPGKQSDTITMAGTDYISGTWNVAITEDTLSIEDLSSLGYCYLKNLDSANFVEFGSDAFGTNYTIRLNAGEFCWFRWGQVNTVIRGLADTAIVKVQYFIWEA